MQAEIISIGTELLMGELTDTNASWDCGAAAGAGDSVAVGEHHRG